MKRFYFILCFFLSVDLYAQDLKTICIRVYAPELKQSDTVFITGNHPKLGNWQPDVAKMNFTKNHTWEKTFELPVNYNLEYKFTRGSWATEAANAKGMPLLNSYLQILNDTIQIHEIKFWRNGKEIKVNGQITGNVNYIRQMKGDGILPRDVIIWLPPGYKENTEFHYPVLYMHDGQNIIDPHTASFKVDWQIDETADSLIHNSLIQPLIIVGINSTSDRNADYSPGIKGVAYMSFIVNKLKPLIDSIYRTKPDREHTVIGGASMGGLISFMLHWEYNAVFGKAICMSSAFQYKDFDYVEMIKKDTTKRNLQVYIDIGDIGLENELLSGNEAMLKELIKKGYTSDKDFFWVKAKNARHFEKDWGIRMVNVLQLFFN